MGWLVISDLQGKGNGGDGRLGHSTCKGPGGCALARLPRDGIMPVGSLMVETAFSAEARKHQRILRYERSNGWLRRVSMVLSADGVLTVEVRQGDAGSHAAVTISVPPREARLRITYSWDAPQRRALLSVENLDQGLLHQAEAQAPLPLPVGDLCAIMSNGSAVRAGPETLFLALSDRIEPVGPGAGMMRGTPVETETGPQLVERLRLGDLVVTSGGALRPVRWIVRREVPALGRFRPVRLRAPYFGLTRDVLVAPDHHLLVSDTETEYLFGEQSVLIQARDLVEGSQVRREPGHEAVLCYYHVLLDEHECLNLAGMWAESLFVGAMARQPAMLATTALAEVPASAIPRHRRFARKMLTDFEAKSLAQALSA